MMVRGIARVHQQRISLQLPMFIATKMGTPKWAWGTKRVYCGGWGNLEPKGKIKEWLDMLEMRNR